MEFKELKGWGKDFLKQNSTRLSVARIFGWWDEIVGSRIAGVTQPVYLKNQILVVEVKEEAWRAELLYHIPSILEKYQKRLAKENLNLEVNNLRFKYNPYLEKSSKTLSKPMTLPLKKDHSKKEAEPITSENTDARLENIFHRLKEYAAGKNIRPHMPDSEEKFPPNEQGKGSPSRIKASQRHRKIDSYYQEHHLHSEFIYPPDELQHFDLY